MALNLEQIRTYVRTHLDIEEEDLPDVVLDTFIREGSKRIERAEVRWPFYEQWYTYTLNPSVLGLYPKSSIGATLDQVANVLDDRGRSIRWTGPDAFQEMQAQRTGASGRPTHYTEWGGNLTFFPPADTSYDLTIRGYRRANDWIADGAGAVPDMPDELHNTVAMWALNRAYLQQEDPELAAVFERQFADELNEYRRRLVVMPPNQPLVLNGGAVGRENLYLSRPRYDWEVI